MAEFIDLTGHRYGLWTVIKKVDRERYWLCRCDCGTVKEVYSRNMRRGVSTNCGCRKAQISRALFTRHGGTRTPLYNTWRNMLERCRNPNRPDYYRYGGRGIAVCSEWADFAVFKAWALSSGYSPSLTLDRINNDEGYSSGNCQWVSRAVQGLNRKTVHMLADGRPAISVSRQNGISDHTFRQRLAKGWTPEEAATRSFRSVPERLRPLA